MLKFKGLYIHVLFSLILVLILLLNNPVPAKSQKNLDNPDNLKNSNTDSTIDYDNLPKWLNESWEQATPQQRQKLLNMCSAQPDNNDIRDIGQNHEEKYKNNSNSDQYDNELISLYYSPASGDTNRTLIISGLNRNTDGINNSYVWDTSQLSNGSYYIHAMIDDGYNNTPCNSIGPIDILHKPLKNKKLILWNKLGSEGEVINSEVGGHGTINNEIDFQEARYGNGAHSGTPETYIWFTNQNFTGLERRGTVEYWFAADFDLDSMPESHIVSIGTKPKEPGHNGGIIHTQIDKEGNYCLAMNAGEEDNSVILKRLPVDFSAGELHHTRICWKVNKINKNLNTIRVYFDGSEVFSTNISFSYISHSTENTNKPDLKYGKGIVALFVSPYDSKEKTNSSPKDASQSSSAGQYFPGIIDNLKIYNYVTKKSPDNHIKSNFTAHPSDTQIISILEPDGIDEAADTNITIMWTEDEEEWFNEVIKQWTKSTPEIRDYMCLYWETSLFDEHKETYAHDDRGHGNDPGGYDPDNPGKSTGTRSGREKKQYRHIRFFIRNTRGYRNYTGGYHWNNSGKNTHARSGKNNKK